MYIVTAEIKIMQNKPGLSNAKLRSSLTSLKSGEKYIVLFEEYIFKNQIKQMLINHMVKHGMGGLF